MIHFFHLMNDILHLYIINITNFVLENYIADAVRRFRTVYSLR